ncbi:hypothetical protein ACKI1J_49065, partial [Streptomyces scabiei]
MQWWAGAGAALAAVLWAGVPGTAVADGTAPLEEPDVAVVVWAGTGRTTSWHAGERDFDRLRSLLDPSRSQTEPVPEDWTRDRRPPVRFTVLWGLTGVGGWPQTKRAPGGDVGAPAVGGTAGEPSAGRPVGRRAGRPVGQRAGRPVA